MKMRKILLIMTSLYAGGAEKQYRYIMESLCIDNEVTVLLVNKPLCGLEESTREYILSHPKIRFIQLNGDALNKEKKGKIIKFFGKVQTLLKQYIWICNNVKEKTADVVMFSYVTQLLMSDFFRKRKIKIIFNERNTGRQVCDNKLKIKCLQKCDKVVCNSIAAAEYIKKKAGIHTEVINNGINIRTIEKKAHEGFNIVVPARINGIKNQMVVVKAVKQLREYMPDCEYSKVKCLFAGTIEDEKYGAQLKAYISEEKLNAEIIGYQKNIERIYEITDLLILPSYEEGTPNVLLEAYMYGIRRLVSNIDTNKKCAISDNILFDPNDEIILARKICEIVQGKQAYLSNQAELEYIKQNYSITAMGNNYQRLIQELC